MAIFHQQALHHSSRKSATSPCPLALILNKPLWSAVLDALSRDVEGRECAIPRLAEPVDERRQSHFLAFREPIGITWGVPHIEGRGIQGILV